MPAPRIVISINAAWNIVNFRQGLIRALKEAGYDVVALAPPDGYEARLAELGIAFVPLQMDVQGTSPVRDLALLRRYLGQLKRLRPKAFLSYTPKPNIYGSLAAHLLGIPVVNNIAGLGTAFIRRGALAVIVSNLYRVALRRSRVVFFQNADDLRLFSDRGLVKADRARLLPGSGIDLSRFRPAAVRSTGGGDVFLLVARLIWDKGIREYVDAARIVRRHHPDTRFRLLGFLDAANSTAIARAEVERWQAEGLIDYLGVAEDVRPHLAEADCVVLPSYREGLPRSLLEAAAMAKPLIASDVPGCRDVVSDGLNGFLHRVRDAEDLAGAMSRFLATSGPARAQLGEQSRALVERKFDERLVIEAYLRALREVIEPA